MSVEKVSVDRKCNNLGLKNWQYETKHEDLSNYVIENKKTLISWNNF